MYCKYKEFSTADLISSLPLSSSNFGCSSLWCHLIRHGLIGIKIHLLNLSSIVFVYRCFWFACQDRLILLPLLIEVLLNIAIGISLLVLFIFSDNFLSFKYMKSCLPLASDGLYFYYVKIYFISRHDNLFFFFNLWCIMPKSFLTIANWEAFFLSCHKLYVYVSLRNMFLVFLVGNYSVAFPVIMIQLFLVQLLRWNIV